MATHLALALHAAGHTIRQILTREYDHAALLARRVGAMPINRPSSLDDKSDIYLLAVNDDALYDLALDLPSYADKLFLHTSGSTPTDVLKRLSQHYGVVWSPQTFVRDLAMDYSHLPLCIEGSSPAVETAIEELFATISTNIYHLDYEQRRWAHLTAVFVNNFGNAVNALAQDLAFRHGIDFSMLRPIAEATVKKMDYGLLWPQQTGPAIRHDQKTIDAQRRLLSSEPQLLQLYDLMTAFIQQPHNQ